MSQSREKNNEGPVFFHQENPFKGLSRAEINAILQSMGEKDAGEFLAEFEKLRALVSKVSPSHLLSLLSVYGLSAAMTASGEIRKRDESETVQQCHIEFIQALVLSNAPEQIVRKHATGEQVQQIWDLVIQLSKHFATQRFQEAIKATTQEERAVQSFQELLRLHTQFIRNWGYFSQVKKISYQLYEPLGAVFKSATGVSTTEIIRFFEALCSIVDERVNHRWQRLSDLFKIKNPGEIVGRYTAMTGGSNEDAEHLKTFLKKTEVSPRDLIALIVTYDDLSIGDIHTFTAEEVTTASTLSGEQVKQIAGIFSLPIGGLERENPNFFFLDNPVWKKPLVQLSDDEFYCPVPQQFFHNIHRVFEALLENPVHMQALEKRRSEFLEDYVAELFRVAFPRSDSRRNVKWKDGADVYETDLLVRVDSFLFIVEAKAGAITSPALRGAPLRLRRHIQDLLVAPSVQSQRLADKLKSIAPAELDRSLFLEPLSDFLENMNTVARISVTLEDFAALQSQGNELAATGWLPPDLKIAPTFSVADLEIVFEILANSAERIHYLSRRNEIGKKFRVIGDELDWLGTYLKSSLSLEQADTEAKTLVLSGMSKELDDYFQARDSGLSPRKPVTRKIKLWRDIGEVVEQRIKIRWSEVAVMLLNVPHADQHRLEKEFRGIMRYVKKNRSYSEDRNALFGVPHPESMDAFAMVALNDANYARRYAIAENIANKVFDQTSASKVLVLIQNVDSTDYPYSMLAVLDRTNQEASKVTSKTQANN